jgi:hypothetical protein
MLRIICRLSGFAPVDDCKMEHTYKTFDVSLPEVEKYLSNKPCYGNVEAIGIELLPSPEEAR